MEAPFFVPWIPKSVAERLEMKKPPALASGFLSSSPSWARTRDPLINSQML